MTTAQNPTKSETQLNHLSWLSLFLSVALLVYAITSLAVRFSLPTDGWAVFEGEGPGFAYLKNLMGAPSGLQPGDRVTAIQGYRVDFLTASPMLKDTWRVGARLDYTVSRAGEEIHVPVTLIRWQAGKWLASLGNFNTQVGIWSNLFLLSLAAFVFMRRPGNPAAGAFLLLMALGAVYAITGALPSGFPEWIDPTANLLTLKAGNLILTALYPFALIRFALVFPRPKPILQRFPWLAFAPGLIGLVLLVLAPNSPVGWFWLVQSTILTVAIIIHNAYTMRDTVSRAQILWGLGGVIFGFGTLALVLLAGTTGLVEVDPNFINLLSNFAIAVMGVMLAVAITRYHLYDIDLIIRKTAVYTVVTGLLVLVYFGGTILLQGLFGRVTGGSSSPLVTVISTLGIVVLFTPLRRRVQDFIDRRFYRQKYDADQTLQAFTAKARDDVELKKLTDHLLAAVQETVHPQSVTLWLREPEIERSEHG